MGHIMVTVLLLLVVVRYWAIYLYNSCSKFDGSLAKQLLELQIGQAVTYYRKLMYNYVSIP